MRQLYTSYKRTWRRVAAPEQVLRNGGWDRADEDLGWLTNDDVRSLTSTNKQAPAKGQRVIDVTVYKRMRCSIITRARSPRFSKVTFSLILAKSSKITIFGTHTAYSELSMPIFKRFFIRANYAKFCVPQSGASKYQECFNTTMVKTLTIFDF